MRKKLRSRTPDHDIEPQCGRLVPFPSPPTFTDPDAHNLLAANLALSQDFASRYSLMRLLSDFYREREAALAPQHRESCVVQFRPRPPHHRRLP